MAERTPFLPTSIALFVALGALLPIASGAAAEIQILPQTTYPGAAVRLIGSGLPPGQPYSLRLDGGFLDSGVTAGNGTAQKLVTLPRMLSLGQHMLNLSSGNVFALATITVVQWLSKVSVSPNVTRAGNNINISGTGFPPDAAYWIYLDGAELLPGATNAEGKFWRAYTLPKDTPLGPHTVTVNATQYTGPPSAKCTLETEQWPVFISTTPAWTCPGTWITITGGNMPPFSLYDVFIDGERLLGEQADVEGSFEIRHFLPANFSLGNHTVSLRVTDYAGTPTSEFTVSLVQWPVQLSADPPRAKTGEPVLVQGCGFPPGSSYRVYLDGEEVRFGEANAFGEFNITYGLPKTIAVGAHQFVAVAPDYSGPPTASADIEVWQWVVTIQVSPKNPHPGSAILISGSGCPPFSYCYVYLDTNLILIVQTDGAGGMLASWNLSKEIALARHNISAVAINHFGPPSATDHFVATQWPLAVFTSQRNATQGRVLKLTGSGFPPLATVRAYWDGIYRIEAGTTGPDGSLLLQINITYPNDESYHSILVNVSDYSGPPRAKTYVWLGRFPPMPTMKLLDQAGLFRSKFYVGEQVLLNASGLPPAVQVSVLVASALPQSGGKVDVLSSVSAATDSQGRIIGFPVWTPDRDGNFSLIVDVNTNGILDDSDLALGEPLQVMKRPDVAVLRVVASKGSIVQGETVDVIVTVANQGPSQGDFSLGLKADSISVWTGRTGAMAPGANQTLRITLATSAIDVGLRNISASADALGNETDLADNLAMTRLAILIRPDIEVRSVRPDKQTIRVGQVLRVWVLVRNLGERPESFNMSLLVDSSKGPKKTVDRLQSGADLELEFAWDTSSQAQGNLTLSAAVDTLRFEREVGNNMLTYGTIVLLGPNTGPVADPDGPYEGTRAAEVLFDASSSHDPDGRIVTYDWSFGDGERGNGRVIRHAYSTDGVFTVVLNVTDDGGAWSTRATTCRINLPTYGLKVAVVDSATRTRLTDVVLQAGPRNFSLPAGYAELALVEGTHILRAIKRGFAPTSLNISLTSPTTLEIELAPVCYIWTSDSSGKDKSIFLRDDTVYVTVSSPGAYAARAYAIVEGELVDGSTLADATGAGYSVVEVAPGQKVFVLWRPPLSNGNFDAVLDLDANGVLDAAYDVVDAMKLPGFIVAENGAAIVATLLMTVLPAARIRRRS